MNTIPRRFLKALPVLALFFTLVTVQVARAQEPDPTLNVSVVESAQAGSIIEVVAILTGPDGELISGQDIEFNLSVEFMGYFDDILIGSATTDDAGIARIEYMPRAEGDHTLVARARSKNDQTIASDSSPLQVTPGSQLYRESSPVRIPGANVWMVAIVLLVVWGVFILIALRIWQIARLGENTGDRADA